MHVICELAQRNAKNYLPLAPQLFQLLTSCTNNWMLIKIVKLFGNIMPEEPRLARKLMQVREEDTSNLERRLVRERERERERSCSG